MAKTLAASAISLAVVADRMPLGNEPVKFRHLSDGGKVTEDELRAIELVAAVSEPHLGNVRRLAARYPDRELQSRERELTTELGALATLYQGKITFGDYARTVQDARNRTADASQAPAPAPTQHSDPVAVVVPDGPSPSEREAAERARLERDRASCQNEVTAMVRPPPNQPGATGFAAGMALGANAFDRGAYFRNCMIGRGWTPR